MGERCDISQHPTQVTDTFNSFGGVIDQNALNNALFETFVVGKVF